MLINMQIYNMLSIDIPTVIHRYPMLWQCSSSVIDQHVKKTKITCQSGILVWCYAYGFVESEYKYVSLNTTFKVNSRQCVSNLPSSGIELLDFFCSSCKIAST